MYCRMMVKTPISECEISNQTSSPELAQTRFLQAKLTGVSEARLYKPPPHIVQYSELSELNPWAYFKELNE